MPIYTYFCDECKTQADYLVRGIMSKPDGCKNCGSENLERILKGQTFSCVTNKVMIDYKGKVHKTDESNSLNKCYNSSADLKPGIHITAGVAKNGKQAINVCRVRGDGKIDASVTGRRK